MATFKQLSTELSTKVRTLDFWLQASVLLALAVMFWPVTQWFAQTAHEQSRLLHALAVLTLASILLVRFSGIQIEQPFVLHRAARTAVYLSFGLVIVQLIGRSIFESAWLGLLSIPAYCAAIASLLLFLFGSRSRRIVQTTTSSLAFFMLLSMLMDLLDWPLRALAGKWSGWILSHLGQSVQLGIRQAPTEPAQLILLVNQHPFHVASECNGFGSILTCLLIAFMLAVYQRLKALAFARYLLFGAMLGFGFNLLRIVVIVLLAPHMMDHYHLMHEIVGALTYWGALILAWRLFKGPFDYSPPQAST